MPIARIQLPDGRIAKFEVPEGTTQDQVMKFVSQQQFDQPQKKVINKKTITQPEAAIAGAGQGATFGFGDEIISGITTPFIYGASKLAEQLGYDTKGLADKSLKEIYQMEQDKSQKDLNLAKESYPKTFLSGEIAGAIGTGKAAMGVKKLQNLPKKLSVAGAGAGAGALYGAGTAEQGEKIKGAGVGVVTGAVGGVVGQKAINVAGKTIQKILPKKDLKIIANKNLNKINFDELKQLASLSYKTAEKEGGVLSSKFTNKLIDKISKLGKKDPLTDEMFGEKLSSKRIKNFSRVYKDKKLTLKQVEELDQGLTDDIADSFNMATGKVDSNGKALQDIQKVIRSSIEEAKPQDLIGRGKGFETYRDATKLWSKSLKLKQIEKMVRKGLDAENPAKSLQRQFSTFLNNDKKLRGFSSQEKKIIENVAKTGAVQNIFSILGNRFIGGGLGFAGGGIPGAAAGIATTQTARKIAEKIQTRKTDKLMNEIVKGVKTTKQKNNKIGLAPLIQAPILNNN